MKSYERALFLYRASAPRTMVKVKGPNNTSLDVDSSRYNYIQDILQHSIGEVVLPENVSFSSFEKLDKSISNSFKSFKAFTHEEMKDILIAAHAVLLNEGHLNKLTSAFFDTLAPDCDSWWKVGRIYNYVENMMRYVKTFENMNTQCQSIDDLCYTLTKKCPLKKLEALFRRRLFSRTVYIERMEKVLPLLELPHLRYALNSTAELEVEENDPDNILKRSICDIIIVKSLAELYKNRDSNQDMEVFSKACLHGALPKLKKLHLNDSSIGDAGILSFGQAIANGALAQLTMLDLQGNEIGKEGCEALADACVQGALTECRIFHLGKNKIRDAGCSAIASACAKGALAKLTQLYLFSNKIGNVGCTALAGAFRKGALTEVTDIQLWENKIGNDGIIALAEAIKPKIAGGSDALKELKILEIGNNKIGVDGFKALTDACAEGGMTKCLYLKVGNNKIGDAGLSSLASAGRKALLALVHLDIRGNRIGDEGLKSLAIACAKGAFRQLTHLDLSNNLIGNVGLKALADSSVTEKTLARLQDLDLSGNHMISVGGSDALADVLLNKKILPELRQINMDTNNHQKLMTICERRDIHLVLLEENELD